MIRRIPILSTLLVAAAIATMVALGFWQLQRRDEKLMLLARYAAAAHSGMLVSWPRDKAQAGERLYRRARIDCRTVAGLSAIAGHSRTGESGMGVTADCHLPDGTAALVVLGWSRQPVTPAWHGGLVSGIIAPGPRLIADPPLAGLEANAAQDPAAIPNNHLSYAVQWFLFAATALAVYVLALRKRLAASGADG